MRLPSFVRCRSGPPSTVSACVAPRAGPRPRARSNSPSVRLLPGQLPEKTAGGGAASDSVPAVGTARADVTRRLMCRGRARAGKRSRHAHLPTASQIKPNWNSEEVATDHVRLSHSVDRAARRAQVPAIGAGNWGERGQDRFWGWCPKRWPGPPAWSPPGRRRGTVLVGSTRGRPGEASTRCWRWRR